MSVCKAHGNLRVERLRLETREEQLCQHMNIFVSNARRPFELTCSITEYERKKKEGIKCSECGSLEVEQQISGFRVQTSKKS